jgi:BNR repeat-like domain
VRRIIAALIVPLSAAFVVAPAARAAAAVHARAAQLVTAGSESGRHAAWTPQRRWALANDWEPDVAASPTSSWVYQMTTRYGHPSTCQAAMRHCVVFRSSDDHGRTWGRPAVMPRRYCPPRHSCELARWQNDPVLVVADTGVIYAIWMNGWNVVFARSADHGRTWQHQQFFRRTAGLSFTDKPWLAISRSGRDVYAAFNSSNSYVASSHDYGATWSRPVRTNTGHRYWFAEGGAVAPGGAVYFAESAEHQNARGDIDLAVLSSRDRGRHWQTRIVAVSQQQPRCKVADCPNDFYGAQISLAAGRSGKLLAAYVANQAARAPQRLYVIASADGRHWGAPRLLARGGTVGADFPKVVAGRRPGRFAVAWEDDRNGPRAWNLWSTRTSNGGMTWGATSRVSRAHGGVGWQRRAGFRFPYGDYFGMSADGTGRYFLTWSDGASYDGPGSTWWSRSVRLR